MFAGDDDWGMIITDLLHSFREMAPGVCNGSGRVYT